MFFSELPIPSSWEAYASFPNKLIARVLAHYDRYWRTVVMKQTPKCNGLTVGFSPAKNNSEKDYRKRVELGIMVSISHISAKELTVMSCACIAIEQIASQHIFWKTLWRKRYGKILWSVPASLRYIDDTLAISNPLVVLHACLEELDMPPRWWINVPRQSYAEHLTNLEKRFGERKQWKLFYFAFGMHWQKWAVAEHRRDGDCWLVIHNTVFNMTQYHDHPGGLEPFIKFAGLDATEAFEAMGHSWIGKSGAGYEEGLRVKKLHIPQEGSILRPDWILLEESVPMWKKVLSKVFLLNLEKRLSYHDFWDT